MLDTGVDNDARSQTRRRLVAAMLSQPLRAPGTLAIVFGGCSASLRQPLRIDNRCERHHPRTRTAHPVRYRRTEARSACWAVRKATSWSHAGPHTARLRRGLDGPLPGTFKSAIWRLTTEQRVADYGSTPAHTMLTHSGCPWKIPSPSLSRGSCERRNDHRRRR